MKMIDLKLRIGDMILFNWTDGYGPSKCIVVEIPHKEGKKYVGEFRFDYRDETTGYYTTESTTLGINDDASVITPLDFNVFD